MRLRPPPSSLAALLAVALLAAGGCRQRPPSALGPAARHYTVRGEVVRVDDGAGGRNVLIRHEAIPDFVDRSGATVGMASMTMPFPAGPEVAKVQVQPGDKVRFRFGLDWERNATELEAIEKLPPDTALVFGK